MSKTLKLAILILIIPALLTSCFESEQLNERMLVQAVGIDLVDGLIEITLQVYAPATQGGSGISATSDNAKIVQASGLTVTQAIQNATLIQGKTVFMGHNRVIVLGQELAKAGIISTLDYFSSNASSRHNINVVIATGKASDILTTKINQGIVPAETLEKMITRANEIGLLKSVKLYELLSTLQNDFESAVLPMIGIIQEETQTTQEEAQPTSAESSTESSGESSTESSTESAGEKSEDSSSQSDQNKLDDISTIKVSGTGIIKDGKLANTLTLQETRGLLFILNEIKDTTFTLSTEDYTTSAVSIYSSKSKITPTIENEKIHFNLEITSQAHLGQRELAVGKVSSQSSIQRLEEATAQLIQAECELAYTKAVIESQADIFEFGNIIWQRNSNFWKLKKDSWEDAVKDITFSVSSKVVINRVGLEFVS